MREDHLIKYPRTQHLVGSRLQDGDEEDMMPYGDILGKFVVLEEKMDGANCGISFSQNEELLLQSRGHFLTGGGREKHFNLLKEWSNCHRDQLFSILGKRFIMFGEWMYAKHSVFYDELPHYFLEFDIYDKQTQSFFSTKKRKQVLMGGPVVSVPVLWQGVLTPMQKKQEQDFFQSLIVPSLAKSTRWQENLKEVIKEQGLDEEKTLSQTDNATSCEGLYGKVEEGDFCVGRFKYIRKSFTQTILDSGIHWSKRPIVPNRLKQGQNIYASHIDKSWPAPCIVVPNKNKKFFV